jgi:hypothetical protein
MPPSKKRRNELTCENGHVFIFTQLLTARGKEQSSPPSFCGSCLGKWIENKISETLAT